MLDSLPDSAPVGLARCSTISRAAAESLAGTAPTDQAWLLVENAGPWGRQAVADSRLPDAVRERLGALTGVRAQLIRRHARENAGEGFGAAGVRVFSVHARPGAAPRVETLLLAASADLLDLDLDALTDGPLGWHAFPDPLWLVCTNGRRDLCCAELGRPVAARLSELWPDATWETTHLGGHRFAGTMLALPSGLVLGGLDPAAAEKACLALMAGDLPDPALLRGPIGVDGAGQAATVAVAREVDRLPSGWTSRSHGDEVQVAAGPTTWQVSVARRTVTDQRLSCADLAPKATTAYVVTAPPRRLSPPPALP